MKARSCSKKKTKCFERRGQQCQPYTGVQCHVILYILCLYIYTMSLRVPCIGNSVNYTDWITNQLYIVCAVVCTCPHRTTYTYILNNMHSCSLLRLCIVGTSINTYDGCPVTINRTIILRLGPNSKSEISMSYSYQIIRDASINHRFSTHRQRRLCSRHDRELDNSCAFSIYQRSSMLNDETLKSWITECDKNGIFRNSIVWLEIQPKNSSYRPFLQI